ncbi:MAG: precorrin-8X methylmutase [SAR324 cluster bacterium]|uniref:Precorrin-8X methylmutase n=1 Tax=SAR324 cluster bacterium TaxID=2024889 RepID=A0A2A4SV31_9DELT|nr:MAG: precorrin-8X methylmutase [SAR324 cluster bacterium]
MHEKNPEKIERTSMEIIEQEMGKHSFCKSTLAVVKRMIHTTGDFDYQNIASILNGAIDSGVTTVRSGNFRIVTDTTMAMAGINKSALASTDGTIDNYIGHDEIFKKAKEQGVTRARLSIDYAIEQGPVDIFVVGNAPTSLFRIGELFEEGKINPKLVIATPVGFVGAADSKEYIRSLKIPTITTIGRKGGSNVAAAVMNAIFYLAIGTEGRCLCQSVKLKKKK